MNTFSIIKIEFFTNSLDTLLRYRKFVFSDDISQYTFSFAAPVPVSATLLNEKELLVILDFVETYRYLISSPESKELWVDLNYNSIKIAGADVDAPPDIVALPPIFESLDDINLSLYYPSFLRIDNTTISTDHPSNFYIRTPYPPITIALFHPQTPYGFTIDLNSYAPSISFTDFSVALHFPQIVTPEVSFNLFTPKFLYTPDIELSDESTGSDEEENFFMFGYETEDQFYEDINEEYEITITN